MESGLPKFKTVIIIASIILNASIIGIMVPLVSSIQKKQNTLQKNITQRQHQQQKQLNIINGNDVQEVPE